MCCEQLVCARCSGPVAEGRCSICRAARAQLHGSAGPALPIEWIVLISAVLMLVAVLAVHLQL